MSPATLTPSRLFDPATEGRQPEPAGEPQALAGRPNGGRPTLEDSLSRVWEGLHADGAAECPVCRGRMTQAPGGGRCRDCGAGLW